MLSCGSSLEAIILSTVHIMGACISENGFFHSVECIEDWKVRRIITGVKYYSININALFILPTYCKVTNNYVFDCLSYDMLDSSKSSAIRFFTLV
jgi:hypothetical protein